MGLKLAEREKDRAFLATKIGLLTIQLNKSDRAHCKSLSFEVSPDSDFGELAQASLPRTASAARLRNDSIPGMGQVLSFQDNKGTTIELFKDWNYLCKHEQSLGIGPLKLGHVAFYTPDVQATVAFTRRSWASVTPTRSATSSYSCAAVPTITPSISSRGRRRNSITSRSR